MTKQRKPEVTDKVDPSLKAWTEHQDVACHVCYDGEAIDREMFQHGYAAALEAQPTEKAAATLKLVVYCIARFTAQSEYDEHVQECAKRYVAEYNKRETKPNA